MLYPLGILESCFVLLLLAELPLLTGEKVGNVEKAVPTFI